MPAVLSGAARKCALPAIFLTGIGWLLVVIGFSIETTDERLARNDPNLYLYWVVCFSGAFTIIAAVIHAVVWHPVASIVGAITSFLNVFFLTGLGMILYHNAEVIRVQTASKSIKLEFAGAITAMLFWTTVMMLWHFYDFSQSKKLATAIVRGIARKLALSFVLLTSVGWLVMVIGFGSDTRAKNNPSSYLYWVVCFTGPFTIMAALVHAVLRHPVISSIFGIIMTLFNALFITALGMILYINGILIATSTSEEPLPTAFHDSVHIEFAGAMLATIFWIPVMILWHLYDIEEKGNGAHSTLNSKH